MAIANVEMFASRVGEYMSPSVKAPSSSAMASLGQRPPLCYRLLGSLELDATQQILCVLPDQNDSRQSSAWSMTFDFCRSVNLRNAHAMEK